MQRFQPSWSIPTAGSVSKSPSHHANFAMLFDRKQPRTRRGVALLQCSKLHSQWLGVALPVPRVWAWYWGWDKIWDHTAWPVPILQELIATLWNLDQIKCPCERNFSVQRGVGRRAKQSGEAECSTKDITISYLATRYMREIYCMVGRVVIWMNQWITSVSSSLPFSVGKRVRWQKKKRNNVSTHTYLHVCMYLLEDTSESVSSNL